MAVAGLRGTGDWGTDERPKNFREYILWRDPNGDAPLTALMSRMRSESVNDPEFNWWEEELNPVRLQVTTAVTTTQTTIAIDLGDAQDLVAGDLLMVEQAANGPVNETYSNEFVEVVSVQSTTQITVTRGAANTTPATIADNAFLTKIGNVYSEGSGSPTASSRNPTKFRNYCQIFKTAYELTRTAIGTHARTGPALQNDKKRKSFDHSAAMELAYLFGKDHETTGSNGKPKRYTGGLMKFLAAAKAASASAAHCVKVWTTTPTEDQFLDAVYPIWDYRTGARGGNERIVLAGNGFLNSLNKLARNSSSTRINFDGTVKAYGMELQRWVFPQGTLFVRTHPLMNVHGSFKNGAFILNPNGVINRPFMKTKSEDNIQLPDADEKKGQWIGEEGPEFHHMKTMTFQGNFIV